MAEAGKPSDSQKLELHLAWHTLHNHRHHHHHLAWHTLDNNDYDDHDEDDTGLNKARTDTQGYPLTFTRAHHLYSQVQRFFF